MRDLVQEQEKIARDERNLERQHQKEEYELEIAKQSTIRNLKEDLDTYSQNTKITPILTMALTIWICIYVGLCRFERFATVSGWPETDWATSLSTLLMGKSSDCKSLKCALLFKYQLTAEGFRNKFRSAKLEVGETYSQLTEKLKDYVLYEQ
ncbi:hypothetical protein HOLleu_05313 [Holothuria leucospilota]|uniref:Uncharacterized protein n=1 Tax=Holothuria leucospilota TaxID=206669 RepID=A0A9Q1HIY7_HOLLE|nr:hypothetical protein HOLleu_05313 [Holothuria leucospilota]